MRENSKMSKAEQKINKPLCFSFLVNGSADIARDRRIVLALASCRKSQLKKIINVEKFLIIFK